METLIEKIREEYQKGRSAKEIADELGFKEKKVRYWMKKGGIIARSWSEATYCKRNPKGDPFEIIKQLQNPRDLQLFFVALGLYLGEGTKKGKYNVALGNIDPNILRTFLNFLRKICNVDESKIFAELNIFDDVSTEDAVKYWAKEVGISKSQIRYVISRKSKGGTYKNKSKYGTLTIKVCNYKLKKIILEWCDKALTDCVVPS